MSHLFLGHTEVEVLSLVSMTKLILVAGRVHPLAAAHPLFRALNAQCKLNL